MKMTYHYTDCGLDNIFLENGYKIHETAYGEGVSIDDVDGLHKAIGDWLISIPNLFNGAELRFIRLEMELTQKNLGDIIGADEQAVRRWEKKRTEKMSNKSAERLLRLFYNDYLNGDGSVKRMIERLNELDQVDKTKMGFCHDRGWKSSVRLDEIEYQI